MVLMVELTIHNPQTDKQKAESNKQRERKQSIHLRCS